MHGRADGTTDAVDATFGDFRGQRLNAAVISEPMTSVGCVHPATPRKRFRTSTEIGLRFTLRHLLGRGHGKSRFVGAVGAFWQSV
jgi:hypothetical protein